MSEKKKITIALTWGSTGWHIFPLLSIYNYLKEEENYNFVWVWENEWLENEIAEENNIKFLDIPAWKVRRYFDLRNFYEPFKNLTWIFFAIYFIFSNKIDIIFSKWWYVSLPLSIAWFLTRKKIYIHESDLKTWIANKIIWKLATKIFYTFPNEKTINEDNKKHILSGQILNPELIDSVKKLEVTENEKLEVLVLAWSQGSTRIFDAILKIIPDFLETINFVIILWEKNLAFKEKFKKYKNVFSYDFVNQKEMWKIMRQADIAITRAWATSLWELSMFWIHSIIVPLKESAWNHQQKNSEFFHKKYWSDVIEEWNDLELKIFQKLKKYRDLRKTWLNLDKFFEALNIIKKEIK